MYMLIENDIKTIFIGTNIFLFIFLDINICIYIFVQKFTSHLDLYFIAEFLNKATSFLSISTSISVSLALSLYI